MKVAYLLCKMSQYVHTEEREKKPYWRIAIHSTAFPYVTPFQSIRKMSELILNRYIKGEIYSQTDKSTRHIRSQQTLTSIEQIGFVSPTHTPTEVSCLEKEETHKIISPLNDLEPPISLTFSRKTHNMPHHHTDNTDAAQDVERMISFFLLFHILI